MDIPEMDIIIIDTFRDCYLHWLTKLGWVHSMSLKLMKCKMVGKTSRRKDSHLILTVILMHISPLAFLSPNSLNVFTWDSRANTGSWQ